MPFDVALVPVKEFATPTTKMQLRGYLIQTVEGYFVLFKDENAAQLGWPSDGLLIRKPEKEAVTQSLNYFCNHFVSVRGKMQAEAFDYAEYWAGLILDEPVSPTAVRGEKPK